MKIFNYCWVLIFLLLISLSCTVIADNVDEQIARETNTYIAELISSDNDKIAATANVISASGLSNAELFDVVEKTTLDYHQKQLVDKEYPELEQVTVSLIRALGSSGNNKYAPTLQKIQEDSSVRKYRKRAKHTLAKMPWYKKRNTIMQNLTNHKSGQELMSTRFLNLINYKDYIFNRYAAEEMYRQNYFSLVVLDAMANKLKQGAQGSDEKVQISTMAWYCRVLIRSKKQEYDGFVQDLISDTGTHKKIKKHCEKELTR